MPFQGKQPNSFIGGQVTTRRVFGAFSRPQLSAIQWDDLEEDLSRCSHYQIPPNNAQLLELLAEAKRRARSLN